jgi:hypothetical protein
MADTQEFIARPACADFPASDSFSQTVQAGPRYGRIAKITGT